MNELDRAIRDSLSSEDARLLEKVGADEALHRQLLATFEGRLRWLNAAGSVAGLLLLGVAGLYGWRFMHATEITQMLRWGAVSAVALAGLVMVKVWFWLELEKNAIVREVKRLELQVASLAARLRQGSRPNT